jgi:hypothetical protein
MQPYPGVSVRLLVYCNTDSFTHDIRVLRELQLYSSLDLVSWQLLEAQWPAVSKALPCLILLTSAYLNYPS